MKKSSQLILLVLVLFVMASLGMAQPKDGSPPAPNPLVRLLQSKGIITPEEATSLNQTASSVDSQMQLAKLLLSKGLISQKEYDEMAASFALAAATAPRTMVASRNYAGVAVPRDAGSSFDPGMMSARNTAPADPWSSAEASAPPSPPETAPPPVIPAVAPIRALGLAGDAAYKRDGLLPVIKIGNDIKIKPYGLFKFSLIHDTSSPQGNDFPLPGFALGDTGPFGSPEFHLNARALRVGADFEWLDPSKTITITGKIETDFEGNFSRANNRNISTIRSNALQIRLGWLRIDKKFSDKTSAFALFGQDWTPFASSTLPYFVETTGLGIGFGSLYERAPQFRFGVAFTHGGSRNLKFEPEFALVLPAYGNLPTDLGLNALGVANQLGFGERQGADSSMPELQGRFVTQFQLDKSPGVAPAQLIASWMYGQRAAVITAAGVPAAFKAAFPTGAQVDSSRYGGTLEAQLPTRWFTLLMKAYNGEDLRFYFEGQIFSEFNDPAGLTGQTSALSIDGASTVIFGLQNGVPTVAPQRPVRAKGGFIELGLPLSRLAGADPAGRGAGWSMTFHYGFDEAFPRDVRHVAPANRAIGDLYLSNLNYKFNKYLTFAFEESYYRTRSANDVGALPIFRGLPAHVWHDRREQLSVMTTF
ncbi:MAG: hypothetical protein LAO31_02450 [Acidobacteriia bacterium]|nr:hypothetical protein [Terriglobia bacterium]